MSTFANAMGVNSHCFTLKDYEEDLKKARNEIFGLKLRIHLLEESQGLAERPDDKENVYRINLDLRVEKEVLKQKVEEMTAQIHEAYFAVEAWEEEKQVLLAKIEELSRAKPEEDQLLPMTTANRPSLLLEAFGSMNLGAHPEDNVVVEELKEKISSLEGDLEVEKDHGEDLKKLLDTRDCQIKELMDQEEKSAKEIDSYEQIIKAKNERIEGLEEQIEDMTEKLKLQTEAVDEKEEVCANLLDTISSLEHQNRALKGQLEMDQKGWQSLQSRLEHDINDLKEALSSAQKSLDEESTTSRDQQTYLNLKLTEIANLMGQIKSYEGQIQALQEELSSTKENLVKTQLCLDGLTEVTMEQKMSHVLLEKELKQKNMINERLVKEYEIAKAKVRKYRSEKTYASSTFSSQPGDVDHNNLSKRELEASKMAYIRQGADKALAKARDVFNQQIQRLDMSHKDAMKMMRKRLEELAFCLEQLLNSGLLDESIRESLQQSLNESRMFNATLDETFEENNIECQVPYINVTLDDLELELGPVVDFENLLNELKAEHVSEIEALKVHVQKLQLEVQAKANAESEVKELKEKSNFVIAEKNSIIEELRVKHGNSREKLKLLEAENAKLKDKTKTLKEMSKLQMEMEKAQHEVSAKEAALKDYREANDKLMSLKNANENELEDLRLQLAKANEKLRQYRERQEKVDKALRIQLAKTHTVLKRTKNQMDALHDTSNKEN